jgi:hypothetical protein
MRAVLDFFPVKERDHSNMLPHCREVMGEENRTKNLGQEGYSLMGKML